MVEISVLLPVNRDDGFLDEAIESVLAQSFVNFELLLIANNCCDELWSYVLAKAKKDSRVKPVRLELGGLCFALNYGINISRGRFIARMDADDVCVNNRLEEQFNFLVSNPSVDLVGSLVAYINEYGDESDKVCFLPEKHADIIKKLPWKCDIVHPSVMAKRAFFINQGGYLYGSYGEDYELWLRGNMNNYKYHILQKKLLKYRSHDNQLSTREFNRKQCVSVRTILYMNFIESYNIKFLFGMFIQGRLGTCLIRSTSRFRNKLKSIFKKLFK